MAIRLLSLVLSFARERFVVPFRGKLVVPALPCTNVDVSIRNEGVVESLPRNPTGKVQRRELHALLP